MFVSNFPVFPVFGSCQLIQESTVAKGDSPVPAGLYSLTSGNVKGNSSKSKERLEPSGKCTIGIGSPQ